MGIFNNNGGLMDQIRCDEKDYLIWKWYPTGSSKGDNTRENAIRWGSSLRVKDGEVAVFVYKQKEGITEDFVVGPFDDIIKTANFPILASIVGLAYDGGTPFQAEVYFINTAKIIQIQFGVPYFNVYDSQYTEFGVPIAVRGTITFKITDYREFIKLHRLIDFNLEDFQNQIRDAVIKYVKNVVTNLPSSNNIPVVQIETKISEVNDILNKDIKERLKNDFGVDVSEVDVSAIEIDKTSDDYERLIGITKGITEAMKKAELDAKVKDIADKQRIDIKNYSETLRIQREEGQYAQRKQTQSSNLDAFQIEKQAEVGIAGAEALGHMGENGTGSISLGEGSSSGFNPAAMMAGMALGGTVGQNIAGTMNNIMNGNMSTMTPPPIPTEKYYVVIDGKQSGPYDINTLRNMIKENQISKESLVWKNGMNDWKKIDNIDELKSIFPNIPPIPENNIED